MLLPAVTSFLPVPVEAGFCLRPNLHSHAWSWSSACGRSGDAIRVEGHGSPVGVWLRWWWGSRHRSLCVVVIDPFTNGTLEIFQIHNFFFFLMFLMSKHTPNNFSYNPALWEVESLFVLPIFIPSAPLPLSKQDFSLPGWKISFPVKSLLFLSFFFFLVSLYSYTECWK